MQNLQVFKQNLDNNQENYQNYQEYSNHLPISFLREMKFFLGITYDDVNQLLIEVEKIKASKKEKANNLEKLSKLTNKEREVFDLVVNGFSTKIIAKKLKTKSTTISTHRKRIKEKLELNSLYDWFLVYKTIQ